MRRANVWLHTEKCVKQCNIFVYSQCLFLIVIVENDEFYFSTFSHSFVLTVRRLSDFQLEHCYEWEQYLGRQQVKESVLQLKGDLQSVAFINLFCAFLQRIWNDHVLCFPFDVSDFLKDTGLKGLSFSQLIDLLKNKWRHISSRDSFGTERIKTT